MTILSDQFYLKFKKPKIKIIKNSSTIILEPVQPGFGHTLGNALRRILLSVIPGCGITSVEIEGIKHIYNNKIGIKEDLIEVLLNFREIYIKLPDEINEEKLYLNKKGIGPVYAKDISLPYGVEIINTEKIICHITDENVSLNMIMIVKRGVGYITSSESQSQSNNKLEHNLLAGKLYMDVNFNPIKKVNYTVVEAILDKKADLNSLDSLSLDIVTNGTISIIDSVRIAAKILYDQLLNLIDFNYWTLEEEDEQERKKLESTFQLKLKSFLYRTVEQLNIKMNTAVIFRDAKIYFVGDLIHKTEKELLQIPKIGQRSIDKLNNIFSYFGFHIGMNLRIWNNENEKKKRMIKRRYLETHHVFFMKDKKEK